MLCGFAGGAVLANTIAVMLWIFDGRFSFEALYKFLLSFGLGGSYLGYVIQAIRKQEPGYRVVGPLPIRIGLMLVVIVFVGLSVVMLFNMGMVFLIQGTLRSGETAPGR